MSLGCRVWVDSLGSKGRTRTCFCELEQGSYLGDLMIGDVGTQLRLLEIARRHLLGPFQHLPHTSPIRKWVLAEGQGWKERKKTETVRGRGMEAAAAGSM